MIRKVVQTLQHGENVWKFSILSLTSIDNVWLWSSSSGSTYGIADLANICPQCLLHYITGISQLCEWHGYSHVTRMYLWIARILRLQPMRKIETKQNWVCQAKVAKLLDLWSQSCQSQNSTPRWSVLGGVVMNYDIDSMLFVWYSQVPQQGGEKPDNFTLDSVKRAWIT